MTAVSIPSKYQSQPLKRTAKSRMVQNVKNKTKIIHGNTKGTKSTFRITIIINTNIKSSESKNNKTYNRINNIISTTDHNKNNLRKHSTQAERGSLKKTNKKVQLKSLYSNSKGLKSKINSVKKYLAETLV